MTLPAMHQNLRTRTYRQAEHYFIGNIIRARDKRAPNTWSIGPKYRRSSGEGNKCALRYTSTVNSIPRYCKYYQGSTDKGLMSCLGTATAFLLRATPQALRHIRDGSFQQGPGLLYLASARAAPGVVSSVAPRTRQHAPTTHFPG